ncbi:hypothetical protein EC5411_24751, partial [Escherichia coli 541-1]
VNHLIHIWDQISEGDEKSFTACFTFRHLGSPIYSKKEGIIKYPNTKAKPVIHLP